MGHSIHSAIHKGTLAHHLLELHELLPILSTRVIETQQRCETAVRALATGSLGESLIDQKSLGHRANVATIIKTRCARDEYFPADWFSDPAWDILLRLYEAHLDHRELTVGELSSFAGTKPTTANRWLELLDARGLIQKRRCEKDQRRVFVSLCEAGVQRMSEYFESLSA